MITVWKKRRKKEGETMRNKMFGIVIAMAVAVSPMFAADPVGFQEQCRKQLFFAAHHSRHVVHLLFDPCVRKVTV